MSHSNTSITLDYLGYVHSPYKEKFAIPRQPGLVTSAKGLIRLTGEANTLDVVRGIEQFSHLWLLFVFHGTQEQGWKPMVRPPRLGGNKKMGVLATRSTFRPNPVGMSVVKLDRVEWLKESGETQIVIHISGLDLLDQTPIIDIKPYIPYSDAIEHAQAGFAQDEPNKLLNVTFANPVKKILEGHQKKHPELTELISQVLAQDPRPAYKTKAIDDKIYGMRLHDFNIQWQMQNQSQAHVIEITQETSNM